MIADTAFAQGGVVSIQQLRAAGLGDGAIKWRAAKRWLHRVHRGVYAVGHRRLGERGVLWAAVLACGGPGEAALSHWAAAALWDLAPLRGGPVDVTTRGGNRSTSKLRVHHGDMSEVTVKEGLPVTTPMRTLRDLARTTTPQRLERLVARAEHLRILTNLSLTDCRKPGGRRLQTVIDRRAPGDPEVTRSELEERFLELVAGAGLERPRVNATVEGLEVDFLWPGQRVIVETDGAATHLTPTAFEHDRRRDQRLTAAGYTVLRFTWRQVVEEPRAVARTLERVGVQRA